MPPGAAQASRTRMPSRGASSGAASCAPRSCTANAPSAKPGSAVTGRGGSTMMPSVPAACAPMPSAANLASSASRVPTRGVDAQRERRTLVADGEHLFPMVRMVGFDAADPPARIRPARDRTRRDDLRVQRVALAQVPAQHRVDERLRLRTGNQRGRVDGAVDDGKRRRVGVVELIQRDGDQRGERRIGDGFARQRARQRIVAAPVAQRSIRQFLHERVAARCRAVVDRGERRRQRHAGQHVADRARRLLLFDLHQRTACGPPRRSARPAPRRARRQTRTRTSACRSRAATRGAAARRRRTRRRCRPCRRRARCPAAGVVRAVDGLGAPHLDAGAAEAAAAPGVGSNARIWQSICPRPARPVDRRVRAADLARIGHAGRRLRHGRELAVARQPRQDGHDGRRARQPRACRAACPPFRAARCRRRRSRPWGRCRAPRPSA